MPTISRSAAASLGRTDGPLRPDESVTGGAGSGGKAIASAVAQRAKAKAYPLPLSSWRKPGPIPRNLSVKLDWERAC